MKRLILLTAIILSACSSPQPDFKAAIQSQMDRRSELCKAPDHPSDCVALATVTTTENTGPSDPTVVPPLAEDSAVVKFGYKLATGETGTGVGDIHKIRGEWYLFTDATSPRIVFPFPLSHPPGH